MLSLEFDRGVYSGAFEVWIGSTGHGIEGEKRCAHLAGLAFGGFAMGRGIYFEEFSVNAWHVLYGGFASLHIGRVRLNSTSQAFLTWI